jgi:hypothetical protein
VPRESSVEVFSQDVIPSGVRDLAGKIPRCARDDIAQQ